MARNPIWPTRPDDPTSPPPKPILVKEPKPPKLSKLQREREARNPDRPPAGYRPPPRPQQPQPQPPPPPAEHKHVPPPSLVPAEYDCYTDQPVYDEEGRRTRLYLPVQQLSRLQRDPGRGMMPMTGKLDPVFSSYLESLDLDELKFALSQNSSPKVMQFLAALIDPRQQQKNITTLAKHYSIGLTEMMQIWRDHKLTTAMGVYIEHAPVLAAHVAEDAKSTLVCCNRCDGAGAIQVTRETGQAWIECVNCGGSGATRKPGDTKSRDLLFKSIGFVKGDGSTVSVNIQNNSSTVESVIEELERLSPVTDITAELIED